ncbi:MAG: hypothetical protein LBP85_10535 [Prevotellaceae bacterium]|nr:hypothetical protein [Prevotellaceae bacterium]
MKTQILVDKKDRRISARHLQPAKSMISNCSANRKQILPKQPASKPIVAIPA